MEENEASLAMEPLRKRRRFAAVIEEFLASSSDSEDDELVAAVAENQRDDVPKVTEFIDGVVRRFDDFQFRKHFRVPRKVCCSVIAEYESSRFYYKATGRGPYTQKTAEEHVLSFLWFAANKTSERAVAVLFGMAESTLHGIIGRVASFLESISERIIRFPDSNEEKSQCSAKFEKIAGFPQVLGCVDGTYVETRCPAHKIASTYTNRHDKKAYGLQAISDSDRKFQDVFLGHTGKTHDAQVFKRAFVLDKLPVICEGNKFHLLGDAAYPVREYLLTPFRDYGKLTPEEVRYNFKLSQTRVRIENAFGLLKGRFRQLLYLEFWTVDRATQFILACCVLHNLCIDAGDLESGADFENEGSDVKPDEALPAERTKRESLLRQIGEQKRKSIVQLLQ